MRASLRALLTGVIDYAGLFPPAGLPLEQAIRNYARYRLEPESWMLGRFVCPAARLTELTPLLGELAPSGPLLALSILAKGANTRREFAFGIRDDIEAIRSFRNENGGRAFMDVYEGHLPTELLAPDNSGGWRPRAFVHGPGEVLGQGQPSLSWFFELVPTSALRARQLSVAEIQTIIADEDPGNFRFENDGFHWKDWRATTAEIELARQRSVISFGSCSFDEPREDLRTLGLL